MPFICYQKNNSPCYYVRFKTENGDYLPEKSTRQREQKQAIKIAWEWYKDGFTGSQQKRKTIKELTLQNELKNADDERINVPGSVNKFNWTYRIPASIEDLINSTPI